jgi:type IV fimbrial biogenesis protein FimT
MNARARGFTLLEAMVVVAIIAIVLALGVPSYQVWIQNLQIRTAAEAIVAGLQVAKNEAIRRNQNVTLTMDTVPGTGWKINMADDVEGTPLSARSGDEGSRNVDATILPDGAFRITFNGLGRIATNVDRSDPMVTIDLDNQQIANPTDRRKLRIVIPTGGGVRMCDKQVVAPDSRACP